MRRETSPWSRGRAEFAYRKTIIGQALGEMTGKYFAASENGRFHLGLIEFHGPCHEKNIYLSCQLIQDG